MNDKETMVEELKQKVKKFVDDRDWSQYHNPKDLAMAISKESSELEELFLWKDVKIEDVKNNTELNKRVCEELADVFIYGIIMANVLGVDLSDAIVKKIEMNEAKYPVEKYLHKAAYK